MNCPNCQQPVPENASFCAVCGTAVNMPPQASVQPPVPPQPVVYQQPVSPQPTATYPPANPQPTPPPQPTAYQPAANPYQPSVEQPVPYQPAPGQPMPYQPMPGQPVYYPPTQQKKASKFNYRNLPSFILGIAGATFGFFGGLCTTFCSSLYSSGFEAFILIFLASMVGLVGACLCPKKLLIGSIIELVTALCITICAYDLVGADFLSVVAMLMFWAGGLIGLFMAIILDIIKKTQNK